MNSPALHNTPLNVTHLIFKTSETAKPVSLTAPLSIQSIFENPVCPDSGAWCQYSPTSRSFVSPASDFEISMRQWQIILLHANALKSILEKNNVEYISFQGVDYGLEDGLAPSCLLPVVIKNLSKQASLILSLQKMSDSALENEFLPSISCEIVVASDSRNIAKELHLFKIAAQETLIREDSFDGQVLYLD